MSREKEGYREILSILLEKYPPTLTRKQTAEALGVSVTHLNRIILNRHITVKDGKIPIGSVASYLCG